MVSRGIKADHLPPVALKCVVDTLSPALLPQTSPLSALTMYDSRMICGVTCMVCLCCTHLQGWLGHPWLRRGLGMKASTPPIYLGSSNMHANIVHFSCLRVLPSVPWIGASRCPVGRVSCGVYSESPSKGGFRHVWVMGGVLGLRKKSFKAQRRAVTGFWPVLRHFSAGRPGV